MKTLKNVSKEPTGNPFLGEGVRSTGSSFELPYELEANEVETRVYAKPKKKKAIPNNQFFDFKGRTKLPDCIVISKTAFSFSSHRDEWEAFNKQDKVKRIDEMTPDVVTVSKKTRKNFAKKFEQQMSEFVNFIVEEIQPMELAFDNSFDTIQQTVSLLTESDVEFNDTGTIRAMFRDAMHMKVLDYITNNFQLNKDQVAVLIQKYFSSLSRKDLEALLKG